MLPPETLRAVENAVRDLDDRQVAWMSGYLAGLRAGAPGADSREGGSSPVIPEGARAAAPDLADAAAAASATILYGSQSGNAKSAATALAERIRQGGGAAEVFDMARYKTAALKREKFLCVVVSTQGEGDPPDSAARFYEFLHGSRAPRLTTRTLPCWRWATADTSIFARPGATWTSAWRNWARKEWRR